MANVNDGSVVWSLNKISNAEQLNGYTAQQIISKIPTTSTGNVKVLTGTINTVLQGDKYNSNVIGTVPLPSGYSRSQCKYAVSYNSRYNVNAIYISDFNQSNGQITAYNKTEDDWKDYYSPVTISYICVAVK